MATKRLLFKKIYLLFKIEREREKKGETNVPKKSTNPHGRSSINTFQENKLRDEEIQKTLTVMTHWVCC